MQRTNLTNVLVGFCVVVATHLTASGSMVTQSFDLTESVIDAQSLDGLGAHAVFAFDTASPTHLVITLQNTSTGVPKGTDAASQLLTAVSFDLGQMGAVAGDPQILSGSAKIGPGGTSVNMSNTLAAGADISGDWGYGNNGTGYVLPNRVTAMRGGDSKGFLGDNLQGPAGGIATRTPLVPMGGQSGYADSVVVTVTLDKALTDLSFLANGVRAEFGSDYRFASGGIVGPPIPEPATISVLVLGGLMGVVRRHRRGA